MEINKSITITANSIISDDGKDILVACMNANIGSDGNLSISKSVMDRTAFDKYNSQVLNDFNEFDRYVYDTIKGSLFDGAEC